MELTIPAAVARAAREFGDAEAVADPYGPGGVRLSYRELDERVTAVTGALIDAGVGPGDRVALWAPNGWQWVLIALGTLGAGAALVPVSTRFTGPEALDVIGRSGARALFVAGDFLGVDRLGALRAAAAEDDGAWTGSGWSCGCRRSGTRSLRAGSRRRGGPAAGGGGAAGGRQRHHVHLGHDRAEQGRDDLARAVPGRGPGLGGLRAAGPGRPVPGGEPVLPHVRLQGGHPGLPGQRGGAGAAGGLRRGRGDAAGGGRADHRAARGADDLPDDPGPPGARRPRPVQPAARRHRRGGRAGRAGRADAARAELRDRAHRLRADRGGGGDDVPPGRSARGGLRHVGAGRGRVRGEDRPFG